MEFVIIISCFFSVKLIKVFNFPWNRTLFYSRLSPSRCQYSNYWSLKDGKCVNFGRKEHNKNMNFFSVKAYSAFHPSVDDKWVLVCAGMLTSNGLVSHPDGVKESLHLTQQKPEISISSMGHLSCTGFTLRCQINVPRALIIFSIFSPLPGTYLDLPFVDFSSSGNIIKWSKFQDINFSDWYACYIFSFPITKWLNDNKVCCLLVFLSFIKITTLHLFWILVY